MIQFKNSDCKLNNKLTKYTSNNKETLNHATTTKNNNKKKFYGIKNLAPNFNKQLKTSQSQQYSNNIHYEADIRLQKALANAGIGSRRACEKIILNNRVQVNNVTINTLGAKVNPKKDKITLDLKPIIQEKLIYILINKPKGFLTSVQDNEGRPTILDLIHNINSRIYPVGRLDFNSEGLILITNDGHLAQKLTTPNSCIQKTYIIKIHRLPNQATIEQLRKGIQLKQYHLRPCTIEIIEKNDNPWLKIVLTEGKNQQLRRMFAAIGHPISKLRRIQFGPLNDTTLKPGEWRFCNDQEIAALRLL